MYNKRGERKTGQHYQYQHDRFGRLVEIKETVWSNIVAEYRYNGLGHRTGWHHDVTGSLGVPDGAVVGTDPWYWLVYDEAWRHVATYRGSDTNLKERFVFHAAGLDGMGSSSYIDEVLFRDRDANTAWPDQADSTALSPAWPRARGPAAVALGRRSVMWGR